MTNQDPGPLPYTYLDIKFQVGQCQRNGLSRDRWIEALTGVPVNFEPIDPRARQLLWAKRESLRQIWAENSTGEEEG